MAGPATKTHHSPNSNADNTLKGNDPSNKPKNPGGRPPLSSYEDPDPTPDFAFSTERIE
jgi:hypothetical protein